MMIMIRIKMISLLFIFILLCSCSSIVFDKFDRKTGNIIFKIWKKEQQ